MKSNQTREWIITCASQLFMTKGYDAISIHEILKTANCSVSLFYYYFYSKDELFNECLHAFFKNYEDKLNSLFSGEKSFKTQEELINFFINTTIHYKEELEKPIHWTFLNSLRHYYLEITYNAFQRIFIEGIEKGLYNITIEDAKALSFMVGQGICSAILYQSKEDFSKQYDSYIKYANYILKTIVKE